MKRMCGLLFAALLTACNSAGDDEPPAAAIDSAMAQTAQDSGPKACELLSAHQVAAANGVAYREGITTHDYGGSSQCRYDHDDGTQGIMFTLHTQRDLASYRAVPGSEPLSGLGDAAVWNESTHQLAVQAGEAVFSISFLTTTPSRRAAVDLAKHVLATLPG